MPNNTLEADRRRCHLGCSRYAPCNQAASTFVRLARTEARHVVALRLRPTTEADLEFVLTVEAHPDNGPFIIPWPRRRHTEALGDPDIAHRVVEDNSGNLVGFVILAGLTSADSSVEFRRIVVASKGQGFGRAIVRAVKELVFVELQAHRLWLDVKEHNSRARALYIREGFSEEGVLRECIRGPHGFESLVIMALLQHEFS